MARRPGFWRIGRDGWRFGGAGDFDRNVKHLRGGVASFLFENGVAVGGVFPHGRMVAIRANRNLVIRATALEREVQIRRRQGKSDLNVYVFGNFS